MKDIVIIRSYALSGCETPEVQNIPVCIHDVEEEFLIFGESLSGE
jgi:hypothetical protein